MELTTYQKEIHEEALRVAEIHEQSEADLIKIMQKVHSSKLYLCFCPSPFLYAVKILKKAPWFAQALSSVARKSEIIPQLLEAIETKRINVACASRLVSQITNENADELIDFAATHTFDEIERELGRRSPRKAFKEKIKYLADDQVAVTSIMSLSSFEELERYRSVQAQKQKLLSRSEAIESAIHLAIEKTDPVKRAERAQVRKEKKKLAGLCVHKVEEQTPTGDSAPEVSLDGSRAQNIHPIDGIEITFGRENMTANQTNTVRARDKGRCTHIDAQGKRCGQDRWTDIHHVIPVSEGGSNHPMNLQTLCWFHHDLVHQMELPLWSDSIYPTHRRGSCDMVKDRHRSYALH